MVMWTNDQAKTFVKQVRDSVKDGWRFMVPAVQRALIEAKAFEVVRMQHAETVSTEAMNDLLVDMLEAAGLTE